MNQTQLQQKITEYYKKLPSDLQKVFSEMKWLEELKSISAKYNLSNEQITILGTETTLVLLGIVHVDKYKGALVNQINIPDESLDNLVDEIEEKILKKINPQLIETFNKNITSLAEEKYGGNKKLDERFNTLPKEIQDAIVGSNYQIKIYELAEKYQLAIDQAGLLEEITNKVMLGIISPDNFENELKSKLELPPVKLTAIINEINEQIFKNIRQSLMNHWEKNGSIGDGGDKKIEDIPIPPYASMQTSQAPSPIIKRETPSFITQKTPITIDQDEAVGPQTFVAKKVASTVDIPTAPKEEVQTIPLPPKQESPVIKTETVETPKIEISPKVEIPKEEVSVQPKELPVFDKADVEISETGLISKTEPTKTETFTPVTPVSKQNSSSDQNSIYSKSGIEILDDHQVGNDPYKEVI